MADDGYGGENVIAVSFHEDSAAYEALTDHATGKRWRVVFVHRPHSTGSGPTISAGTFIRASFTAPGPP